MPCNLRPTGRAAGPGRRNSSAPASVTSPESPMTAPTSTLGSSAGDARLQVTAGGGSPAATRWEAAHSCAHFDARLTVKSQRRHPPRRWIASKARCYREVTGMDEQSANRARGALLGLAAGDALGTTLEFTTPDAPSFPTRLTGPHRTITARSGAALPGAAFLQDPRP